LLGCCLTTLVADINAYHRLAALDVIGMEEQEEALVTVRIPEREVCGGWCSGGTRNTSVDNELSIPTTCTTPLNRLLVRGA
jgi:hypothetical protein